MVNNAVVVPCATLAAIACCMLIYICWWFPRAWAKGQTADLREYEARRIAREQMELDLESGNETGSVAGVPVAESGKVQGKEGEEVVGMADVKGDGKKEGKEVVREEGKEVVREEGKSVAV